MAPGQTRFRRRPGSQLAALLCSLLLLVGDGAVRLPCLTAQGPAPTSEEEVPSGKTDPSCTGIAHNPAGGRPRLARRHHKPVPFPLQPAVLPGLTDSSRQLPPPRERERLNGVGAPLRC